MTSDEYYQAILLEASMWILADGRKYDKIKPIARALLELLAEKERENN